MSSSAVALGNVLKQLLMYPNVLDVQSVCSEFPWTISEALFFALKFYFVLSILSLVVFVYVEFGNKIH